MAAVRSVLTFIRLSRPYNSLLPLAAIVAGYLAAGAARPRLLVVTIFLFTALHAVVTVWNDITDEAGDRHNHITRIATIRQAGQLHAVTAMTIVLAVASPIAGGLILPFADEVLLLAYLMLGWLYNARPARLSRRPLASMIVLLLAYGSLPFALGAALGRLSGSVLLLGVGWSLARLSLSLMKDYKDAPGDAKAAKKTFLLVYGNRLTARISMALLVIGLSGVLGGTIFRLSRPEWLLLSVIAAWLAYERTQLLRVHSYAELHAVFRDGLRYQLLFDGMVIICLITS